MVVICPLSSLISSLSPSLRTGPVNTRPSVVTTVCEMKSGIDREAGERDVAQHRLVVAVRQIGQIGTDRAPFAAHRVTLEDRRPAGS